MVYPYEPHCQICGVPLHIRYHDVPYNQQNQDGALSAVLADQLKQINTSKYEGPPVVTSYYYLHGLYTLISGYVTQRVGDRDAEHTRTILCLAPKGPDWEPEDGDEEFEIAATHCFIQGPYKGRQTARHGMNQTPVLNYEPNGGALPTDVPSIPMHLTCFSIFMNASIKIRGHVDIDLLWNLRKSRSGAQYNRFKGLPILDRHYTTHDTTIWDTKIGSEWLVANPIGATSTESLLSRCQRAADYAPILFTGSDQNTKSDPFQTLPPELNMSIVQYLSRQDTASLRLASRSFRRLPQVYFRFLVKSEMPWLFEILDDRAADIKYDWYKLFSAIHSSENSGIFWDKEDEEFGDWLFRAVRRYYNSHDEAAWARFQGMAYIDRYVMKIASGESPAREDPGFRGLRNRKRIWNDLEKIFELAREDNL
ncbi:hypothetical protein F5Y04DRAFT_284578 [Hypomontagnella monticulosa]|nr:hypothetical protein F5Y04DRAFT_284578 [Hypomontagnella monticulosa]